MLTRNKIRLCRSLRAQTTPYPEASGFLKRALFVFLILVVVGIYIFAKPAVQTSKQNQSDAPKQILGEQQKAPEYNTYEIKKGDTLFNLSNKFEVSWQTLAEINHLREPYILKIGQTIQIPK
jgi:lipoprotein NlpD